MRPTDLFAPILAVLAMTGAMTTSVAGATIVVMAGDCDGFAVHRPEESVTYMPGRDANGREVTPADLASEAPIVLPERFTFVLNVDLQDRGVLPKGPGGLDANLPVGEISVEGGVVSFNGRPLGDRDQAAVLRACREHLRKSKRRAHRP